MFRPIPLYLPSSPTKTDRPLQLLNTSTTINYSFGNVESTPFSRDLYRTCMEDDLRKSPNETLTCENNIDRHNVSCQAFNTPYPIKALGEVVRVISGDDVDEASNSASSPPRDVPLSTFQVVAPVAADINVDKPLGKSFHSVVIPPTPFLDSEVKPTVQSKVRLFEEPAHVVDHIDLTQSRENRNAPNSPKLLRGKLTQLVNSPAQDTEEVQQENEIPLINVEFKSWALLPTRKFSGFFVEGLNTETNLRANTSKIVERIDFFIVKSASGAVIRLIGAPDERRMHKFHISQSFISLFSKGFPTDWMHLVDTESHRLHTASEGVRNGILKLLKEMMQQHQPVNHSRDFTLSASQSTTTQSSQSKIGRKGRKKKEDCDADKTVRLPPIVETPDHEFRVGPHHFPIETFTPAQIDPTFRSKETDHQSSQEYEDESESEKNLVIVTDEEGDDNIDEEGGLDSSSSILVESDIEEEDSREHYSRRRARQGNKPPTKKAPVKKTTAVPAKKEKAKQPVKKASAPKAKVSNTQSRGKKTDAKASHKEKAAPAKKGTGKTDILTNYVLDSTKKSEPTNSFSTDLLPPHQNPKPLATKAEVVRNTRAVAHDEPSNSAATGAVDSTQSSRATRAKKGVVTQRNQLVTQTNPEASVSSVLFTNNLAKPSRKRKEPSPPAPQNEIKAARLTTTAAFFQSLRVSPKPTSPSPKCSSPVIDATSNHSRPKRSKKVAGPVQEPQPKVQRSQIANTVAVNSQIPPKSPEKPRRGRSQKAQPVVEAPTRPVDAPVTVAKAAHRPAHKEQSPISDQYELHVEDKPKNAAAKSKPKRKQIVESIPSSRSPSPSPVREPNPLKAQPAKDASRSSSWTEAEIERLKRATLQVPTTAEDYWQAVANLVGTKSGSDCFTLFNKRMDIQKAAHCNLMLSKSVANPGNPDISQEPLVPPSPEKETKPDKSSKKPAKKKTESSVVATKTAPANRKGKQAITAGAGTLKRREQIRAAVQAGAEDDWLNRPADISHYGAKLTQSEYADLLGDNNALVTPSALPGTLSMVTAGGQGLSVGDVNNGHSIISSALELPDGKERQNADKVIARVRGAGTSKEPVASRQGNKTSKAAPKAAAQTMRKKAMALDHLSPVMAPKLRGFMPKNMSTPHIPTGRHANDDTLTISDKTLTSDNNDLSPIGRK